MDWQIRHVKTGKVTQNVTEETSLVQYNPDALREIEDLLMELRGNPEDRVEIRFIGDDDD